MNPRCKRCGEPSRTGDLCPDCRAYVPFTVPAICGRLEGLREQQAGLASAEQSEALEGEIAHLQSALDRAEQVYQRFDAGRVELLARCERFPVWTWFQK